MRCISLEVLHCPTAQHCSDGRSALPHSAQPSCSHDTGHRSPRVLPSLPHAAPVPAAQSSHCLHTILRLLQTLTALHTQKVLPTSCTALCHLPGVAQPPPLDHTRLHGPHRAARTPPAVLPPHSTAHATQTVQLPRTSRYVKVSTFSLHSCPVSTAALGPACTALFPQHCPRCCWPHSLLMLLRQRASDKLV